MILVKDKIYEIDFQGHVPNEKYKGRARFLGVYEKFGDGLFQMLDNYDEFFPSDEAYFPLRAIIV